MNRFSPKAGLGASSIMLILVTLCLTVFSVLAFISAGTDKNLTQTAAGSTAAYYAADSAAQKRLMELDSLLQKGQSPDTMDGIAESNGEYSFFVEIDENRVIAVRFTVEEGAANITGYRVEAADSWEPEAEQTLYQ